MSYSRFINGMVNMNSDVDDRDGRDDRDGGKKIVLNRKVLADLAANEPFSFKAVVDVVKMKNASK
jgi:ribosomal protein L20